MFGASPEQLKVIGGVITVVVVTLIILLTLWVKWDEWFGTKKIVSTLTTSPTPEPAKVEVVEVKTPPAKPVEVKVKTTTVSAGSSSPTTNVFKYALGLFMALAIFAAVLVVLINVAEYYKDLPSRSATSTTSQSRIPLRAETEEIVKKFWNSRLPVADSRTMIKIAEKESGFIHYNSDGSVLTNTNKNGTVDTCVMQINSLWLPKAKQLGLDITDVDECLEMALHIYKEKGPQAWSTFELVAKTEENVIPIVAPVKEWSPPQKVKANCMWRVDRTVQVRYKDQYGEIKIHDLKPNSNDFYPVTWEFEISVPDEPVGNMDYRCTT